MLQVFVEDTYGRSRWDDVLRQAGLGRIEVEAMLRHDPALTDQLAAAVEAQLSRPIGAVLEDVGTYLVSHPNAASVRRLLRFCGVDFADFLFSLEDLPGRITLAVPELSVPTIEVIDRDDRIFDILCRDAVPGFAELVAGLVRAMADDFGSLAVIDHVTRASEGECIRVTIIERDFTEGRAFPLVDDATGAPSC
ncbi:Heme NO binding protein [Roseivivax jejudonensis]|uniref:Heme NO binding protein n=2 Tax=Roseivivax jejudonensis TaxID=1529041 RepID=A0A1X6Y8Y7_9RHOB|nr:Heme NO binding protein [Roseivivax jejudonensis]